MVYPRAMNNKEKKALALIKKSGLSFSIKFKRSLTNDTFLANINELKTTYCMNTGMTAFTRDLEYYLEKKKAIQLELFS
jgi:hypothetical protein